MVNLCDLADIMSAYEIGGNTQSSIFIDNFLGVDIENVLGKNLKELDDIHDSSSK